MKKIFAIVTIFALVVSCGEKKEEKKDSFEMNRTKKETKTATTQEGVPIDMDNKGIGPITAVSFDADINKDLVAQGETLLSTKVCTACHNATQRLIGPALSGIYERRSPEWVMNMMLNPSGMLQEDPIAKALLKEYNNAIMTDSNLTEEEARALAEYLRTL